MSSQPNSRLDRRFSAPDAEPTPWSDVVKALEDAELYWLTTVRADGRPHVTPLVGVHHDGVVHFVTGLGEQKARNLSRQDRVALTTGSNTWAEGLDVVVEGTAVRVTAQDALRRIAEAFVAKYAEAWRFEVGDGVFHHGSAEPAAVFRIEPAKVLAFSKNPHAQTTFRFTEG
jgi:nitroimidazol reductase NimA-like FMN-containing flavoprotein (pyridoxamine 5'-phosphate oxidase superfamily)